MAIDLHTTAAAAMPRVEDVFAGVYFAIVLSDQLRDDDAEKLIAELESHGAVHCPLHSSELRHITHLISRTSDFPAYHDAVDGFIHVVRPLWVEQSILKKKAQNPRQYSPDPKLFFSDVIITCADGLPEGDKDAIIGGVFAMGGQYSSVLTMLVTHVVALTMNNPQCKLVVEKKLRCKVVLPHWFDDCLKLGRKINHGPYILPNPQILTSRPTDPMKQNSPSAVYGASTLGVGELPQIQTPPATPSQNGRRQLGVFKNKTILLHPDLSLSDHLEKSIIGLVVAGGGTMTKKVQECDMLICQFRESEDYRTASRAGKDVGNLLWLYHLINHNAWTSPTRRLLHYPRSSHPVPGFENFKISISNYTGEARVYLESLIRAAGGRHTKTMMQENTHLITAHTFSEKCDAAKEWNINMVNHLWLEESYAKWEVQSLTNTRYTTFPARTNLCEVVGQTQIDREAVERRFFKERSRSSQSSTGHLETLEANSTPARTSSPKSSKSTLKKKDPRTPASVAGGKENETPGSRGAKERALNKLHSMAPDIALFEKESKRVGGVVYGGRKVGDADRITTNGHTSRKRGSSKDDDTIVLGDPMKTETLLDGVPKKKKQKKTRTTTSSIIPTNSTLKVLVTGYGRWTNDATSHAAEKTKLKSLGIHVVSSLPADGHIDVLAAPHVLRTRNFLAGISAAAKVVSTDWIEKMLERDKQLDADDFKLRDREGEERMAFSLKEAIARAKVNKANGGLLKDWVVFCTESVKGSWEAFEEITRVNGGKCHLFKGRETRVPPIEDRSMTSGAATEDETEVLHLITDPKDRSVWTRFCKMARQQGYSPRLVRPDWLLRVAASQDLTDWKDEWLFEENKDTKGRRD